MRIAVLIISISLILISGIWFYFSGFQYEQLITLLSGIGGILEHLINNKRATTSSKVSNESSKPNLNLNLTISHKEDRIISSSLTHVSSRNEKIEYMKPRVKILFIDDDKNFNIVKILKQAGWKNTKSVEDIKTLDAPNVKDSDIYFVDINGVGRALNCEHQGLDIALMLKQKYPNKKVIIYSANKSQNSFHRAWDVCDFKLEKNALAYQFQSIVEQYSIELLNNPE